mgnify:CR=1 FL=1
MTLLGIIVCLLSLGIVVGGFLMLRKSARKFNLTPEQLEKIKKRNEALDKEEEKEKEY